MKYHWENRDGFGCLVDDVTGEPVYSLPRAAVNTSVWHERMSAGELKSFVNPVFYLSCSEQVRLSAQQTRNVAVVNGRVVVLP